MSNIVLMAETGADIPPALAQQYGICLVPMHVTMGDKTLDDASFPSDEICSYYDRTGCLPKTSGCSPEDFARAFQKIHQQYPDRHILHLAYSAVTTVSYQSALIAAEGLDYVTSIDTKHVSAGQAAIVLQMARMLERDPNLTVDQAVDAAQQLIKRTRMCFLPKDLEYLRAGGRVSNVVALGGRILNLHPCIEIIDGYLLAKKKYRGSLEKVVPALIREYSQREKLEKDRVTLIWSVGLPDHVRKLAEQEVERCGFRGFTWCQTGCVITTHGGPGCFGIVGFAEDPAETAPL